MDADGLAVDALDRRVLSPCNGKVIQVHRKTRCSSVRQKKWIGLGKRSRLAWQAAAAVLQLLPAFGLPFRAAAQSDRYINDIQLLFPQEP
jgi:hypothetical protein